MGSFRIFPNDLLIFSRLISLSAFQSAHTAAVKEERNTLFMQEPAPSLSQLEHSSKVFQLPATATRRARLSHEIQLFLKIFIFIQTLICDLYQVL